MSALPSLDITRARLLILGAVQGVGFRPTVFKLANDLGLAGWVNNSPQGVTVEIEGTRTSADEFILRLDTAKPPRSSIRSVETAWLAPAGYRGFAIRESETTGPKTTLVMPDIATCPECLTEILDSAGRRYLYPFTNCTHCGPRFTIIDSLPYDRMGTSMRVFEMCPHCRHEYENPSDRRFHAQPIACPDCGPQLQLRDRNADVLCSRHDALLTAAHAIRCGKFVAVKGIGGFHLMADARNQAAVTALRERKHREEKPLAIMAPSLNSIRCECEVSAIEERLLLSPEAPILLLRRRAGSCIAPAVAPGNPALGMMLPSNPLHHLLMRELGFPVVATSANLSGEPICIDNEDCQHRMGGIADLFLVHNRRIVRHVDDSLVRVTLGREMILRRARGYAPLPIHLAQPTRPILATGAHLKNTVALASGHSAFISQHIGDLETVAALDAFERVISDFQRLYEIRPEVVAMDTHPDYLSSQSAQRIAAENRCPAIPVQHHIAHVLSCMAENEIDGPALGVAWDGTGYGLDGTIWGGEFFNIGAGGNIDRYAHFRTFPLPGGEIAIREPRRSALGLLTEVFGKDAYSLDVPPINAFTDAELARLRVMLDHSINSPRTSSAGRLFDVVAALTGIRQRTSFEGQAAMDLESAASDLQSCPPYPFTFADGVIDWAPMIRAIVTEVRQDIAPALISTRFHRTLARIITDVARHSGHTTIVLSGGCFQNERLLSITVTQLRAAGLQPVWHRHVPTNDGGIALGQIAACLRNPNPA